MYRACRINCGGRMLRLAVRILADGKIEQYLIARLD